MIAEHQLLRVRLEIELARQVRHVVHADVVTHQRQRHDERHQLAAVVVDRGQQLAPSTPRRADP